MESDERMEITETLYVSTARAWRAWLKRHHRTAREIFLIYYKKHTGEPRISYNDAVDQALCFGWIDGITKPIDGDRWCQRFTPRRKGSSLSELNKARVRRLIRTGEMTRAGIDALHGALRHGAKIHRGRVKETVAFTVPARVVAAVRKNPAAWKYFRKLPKAYLMIRIRWITAATHRLEVFRQRLNYFVRMTAQGKRFGMIRK